MRDATYAPKAETIKNRTYPILIYIYMYLKSSQTGFIKAYVDWFLSPEGQIIITEIGYFPVNNFLLNLLLRNLFF